MHHGPVAITACLGHRCVRRIDSRGGGTWTLKSRIILRKKCEAYYFIKSGGPVHPGTTGFDVPGSLSKSSDSKHVNYTGC